MYKCLKSQQISDPSWPAQLLHWLELVSLLFTLATNMLNNASSVEALYPEIWLKVFSYLKKKDLCQALLTCRSDINFNIFKDHWIISVDISMMLEAILICGDTSRSTRRKYHQTVPCLSSAGPDSARFIVLISQSLM